MPALILIYGLPGAGKTSLAAELSRSGWSFANLARHPEFRRRPMAELAAELFSQQPSPKGLVVEAVLASRASRIQFLDRIQQLRAGAEGGAFDRVVTFFLSESPAVLSRRRNRTAAQYEELLRTIEIGNPPYEHHLIDGADAALRDVGARAEHVHRILERR